MIYKYNKLVRDKIPNEINSLEGRNAKWRVMDDKEYVKELNRKVLEEANEFIEENDIEELADLIEVIENIMRVKNYSWDEVEEKQNQKRLKKGGFIDKIYLESVEETCRNIEEEKELNKAFRK